TTMKFHLSSASLIAAPRPTLTCFFPSSPCSPEPCRKRIDGWGFSGLYSFGTKTTYFTVAPLYSIVLSRKPVSGAAEPSRTHARIAVFMGFSCSGKHHNRTGEACPEIWRRGNSRLGHGSDGDAELLVAVEGLVGDEPQGADLLLLPVVLQ